MAGTMGVNWTPDDVVTFRAGADLSSGYGSILAQHTTAGQVVKATAGTAAVDFVGVQVRDADSSNTGTGGAAVPVVPISSGKIVKVRASAAIALGAFITATADGEAVTTTAATDRVVGLALEACSNANEYIEVLLGAVPAFAAQS